MTELLVCGAMGAMGKILLEELKRETDMRATCGVDLLAKTNRYPIYKCFLDVSKKVDAVVDFSSPNGLEERLDFVKTRKIPLVVGTTGLTEQDVERIKTYARQIPIFVAANFSPAVFLLEKLAEEAAKRLVDFDAAIVETHRLDKKDRPSGTAKTIAESLNKIRNEKIPVHSLRGGSVTGTHDIVFFGNGETLTLSHRAEDKRVFAIGAIQATKFLLKKRKGLFGMKDLC